jgi:prolyl-tRNA synthetase
VQVVVVPVGVKKEIPAELKEAIDGIVATCKAAGIRVKVDDDVRTTPGFKFNHYELLGVPVRVEVGMRDVEKGCCVTARWAHPSRTYVKRRHRESSFVR